MISIYISHGRLSKITRVNFSISCHQKGWVWAGGRGDLGGVGGCLISEGPSNFYIFLYEWDMIAFSKTVITAP